MHFKSLLFVLILSVVVTHNVQGTALLKAKIGLLKAKAVAVAAPHVAARIAVAKEVKAKKAFAFAQSIAAIKASKAAAISAITAPFRVAKKTVVFKAGALAAAKALKVAKVAHVVGSLKKPILIPVGIPIPFPVKIPLPIPFKDPFATLGAGVLGFKHGVKVGSAAGVKVGTAGVGAGAAGLGLGALGTGAGLLGTGIGAAGLGAGALGGGAGLAGLGAGALGAGAGLAGAGTGLGGGLLGAGLGSAGLGAGLGSGLLGSALGAARSPGLFGGAIASLTSPVQGFINGAQSLLQGFGSTSANGVDARATVSSQYAVPEATQQATYQFVPISGSSYNRIQSGPHTTYEVPHTSYEVPHTSYEVPSQYGIPHH